MSIKEKLLITLPGYPLPLGATLVTRGVNFSIFSRNATGVTLVLFDSDSPDSTFHEIELKPGKNKTGDIWHIWVEGIKEGQLYGYRLDGPYAPEFGHRFNKNKLLIDPYARSLTGNFNWNVSDPRGFDVESQLKDSAYSTQDSAPGAPKCIVINHDFDWFDRPQNTHFKDTIIYEAHVKGFSFNENSGVKNRGTYRGIVEKIPYLKELGITAIELLPIQEFDENENLNVNPETGERLHNYWGYSTISFFAPKGSYSSGGYRGEQYYEFKEMVRDLHNAGIEVILDVVFNHTAEGDHRGPTIGFRGIDNKIYYMLEENKKYYKNYAGCGNTFNCNHPLVRDFILDCLKFWVVEMHIDGFRFDLASILGRDRFGNILTNPPLIERIEDDPILRDTKIIAEAWDAAGAYQVGHFPGRWAEWNGRYRDDIRGFWRGDDETIGKLATRLAGSSDLYQHSNRSPLHSINFITSHDGFPLNDLVSYNHKHNYANGENNRDGDNHNNSYNYGIEGADVTPYIDKIRDRQLKNMMSTLFLSQGVPMLYAGDELRRSQHGNNNAYCQDNETSWIDWSLKEKNKSFFEFTKKIIQFRKNHPVLRRKEFFAGSHDAEHIPDISWHGKLPYQPDWGGKSKVLGCMLNGEFTGEDYSERDNDIYMIFNSSLYNFKIKLPAAPGGRKWKRIIDTSMDHPDDFLEEENGIPVENNDYYMRRQSTIVFISY